MTTLVRAVLTAILSLFLVGFGLCGAYGTFGGLVSSVGARNADSLLFLIPGLMGLGIAWVCWKAIAGIWRKPGPPAE